VSRVLEKCDVILLASEGHGFEMLGDAELIEVNQDHIVAAPHRKKRVVNATSEL
jgi:hypothetical protein